MLDGENESKQIEKQGVRQSDAVREELEIERERDRKGGREIKKKSEEWDRACDQGETR